MIEANITCPRISEWGTRDPAESYALGARSSCLQ